MELDDVGKKLPVGHMGRPLNIIMGIKTPCGQCFLFADDFDYTDGYPNLYLKHTKQAEAIKTFMEEHVND